MLLSQKCTSKKAEIPKGRGVHDYGILRAWGGGVTHSGISEGEGGLNHGSRPWLGMDIFWNCPLSFDSVALIFTPVTNFLLYG